MNKSIHQRPNRVVTCPECGSQMPQRYLARHTLEHAPATIAARTPVPEIPSAPEAIPQRPMKDASPAQPCPGMLICPACAAFVAPPDFASHMDARHAQWCPLCQADTKDLAGHLSSSHRLKAIKPAPPYPRDWQTQPRFICLGCHNAVSVWSYPRHAQPHGATRGQPRTGKRHPA